MPRVVALDRSRLERLLAIVADGRYVIIIGSSREHLRLLSRQPALTPAEETGIQTRCRRSALDRSCARETATLHAERGMPSVYFAAPRGVEKWSNTV